MNLNALPTNVMLAQSWRWLFVPEIRRQITAHPVGAVLLNEIEKAHDRLAEQGERRRQVAAAVGNREARRKWIGTVHTFVSALDLMELSEDTRERILSPLETSIEDALRGRPGFGAVPDAGHGSERAMPEEDQEGEEGEVSVLEAAGDEREPAVGDIAVPDTGDHSESAVGDIAVMDATVASALLLPGNRHHGSRDIDT